MVKFWTFHPFYNPCFFLFLWKLLTKFYFWRKVYQARDYDGDADDYKGKRRWQLMINTVLPRQEDCPKWAARSVSPEAPCVKLLIWIWSEIEMTMILFLGHPVLWWSVCLSVCLLRNIITSLNYIKSMFEVCKQFFLLSLYSRVSHE